MATDARYDQRQMPLGAGAVALLLSGQEGDTASITHLGSRSAVFRDRWRLDGQVNVHLAERSLAKEAAADAASGPWGNEADILSSPVADPIPQVGDAGCADLLLRLLLAGGTTASGEAFTAVCFGGGVSYGFRVEPGPRAAKAAARALDAVEGGLDGTIPPQRETAGLDPFASQARSWRDVRQDLRLEGARDATTGEVLFPPPPTATAPNLEPYRLARRGTVLTFTRDHIFPQSPPTEMAVVDLEGGGRFYGQVAGSSELRIGFPVRLVLRRLHDGGGIPHYFWKVMPQPIEARSAVPEEV